MKNHNSSSGPFYRAIKSKVIFLSIFRQRVAIQKYFLHYKPCPLKMRYRRSVHEYLAYILLSLVFIHALMIHSLLIHALMIHSLLIHSLLIHALLIHALLIQALLYSRFKKFISFILTQSIKIIHFLFFKFFSKLLRVKAIQSFIFYLFF